MIFRTKTFYYLHNVYNEKINDEIVGEIHMNIQQLNCFIAASNSHSFSLAAKKIYMSQPNFSKNIKSLEEELGIRLFNRTNKGISLTEEGKDLSNRISVIMNQLDDINQYYNERKNVVREINISSLPIFPVIKAISKLREEKCDEGVVFQFIETDRSDTIDKIIQSKCELGFIMTSSIDPLRFNDIFKENYLSYHLLKESYCNVYIRKNHPLAKKKFLTYADLKKYKKIVFNLDGFTKDSIIIKDRYSIITNSISLTQIIIESTNDYLIQTPWDKEIFLTNNIVAIPLLEKNVKTQIGYVHKKNMNLDSILEELVQQVCYNLDE